MNALDPGERQAEAADAGASVWVAASAGTGKTTVLANRVLALMLGGGPPERILCLTFTKAAAAEMANRINDNLSRWVSLGDGALHQELHRLTGSLPGPETLARARRLFALVLDAPGGMKIATIHAFCQSLLRRFPLEAGVAPHFEVMDERSAADAQNLVRDRVLARARSGEDEALAAALAEVTRHVREEGFATLMKALTLDRARLDEALGEGHAAFMTRLARCLEVDIQSSEADILAAACASGAFDEAALKAAARSLMESDKVTDQRQGGKLAAWLAEPTERADRFEAYLGIFFTLQGKPRDRVMTASLAKRRPSAAAALDAEGARLAAVVAQRRAQALFQASDALVRLGHAIVSAYAAYKADRALLDYDDLVLGARNLLRQPDVAPWVLFKLDGGLDHILIDEAQDTNPWQWEVVASLTEEFFAGEGARPLGRTVFAVGDAKQSIFSFQRADPESFLRMRRHFADRVRGAGARWKVIDLDMSFRSTEAVLTAVDAVFAAAGRAVEGVALDGAPIRHTPFRQGAAGLVELWPPVEVIEAEAPPPWELPLRQHQKAAPSTRLAKAMAAQMRAWFEGGERLEARDRVMRPRDVMVLVRRRGSFVGDLVRALKSNGVEVAGADRMELTQQLVVQDMMALGAFLVLPEDDLTLATVLKGPRFGFDDARLFDLAFERKEPRLWHELRRRAGENDAYHRAASELGDFLARADRVPPFELFAGILSADGGRREVL
ncbi:MAG TPA: UvrD-helicase domain-containing protein, partial [Stellaceae bacterium]|nr:UvrD-helicase domain-containing protein [Stellaceae bacterium]